MDKAIAGKFLARDHVMKNTLNMFVGEGIGDAYLQALQQADAEVDAALKASVGD